MRIVSWNINSIRSHLPRLLALLRRHRPDVVCLQETKVSDNRGFPITQLSAAGYNSIRHGQRSYNGVAILVFDPTRRCNLLTFNSNLPCREVISYARTPYKLRDVQRGFSGNPLPDEARVISACVGNLRFVNVYVVNGGGKKGSNNFTLKQCWMASLGKWLKSLPKTPSLLVVGDFNVAPDDRDVWDPTGLKDRIHCTVEEREWLRNLQGNRLQDLLRATTKESGIYTWWPYQRGAFDRNEGLRFDLAFGDKAVVDIVKRVWVDREERRPSNRLGKPSDHAPVIIDLIESGIN